MFDRDRENHLGPVIGTQFQPIRFSVGICVFALMQIMFKYMHCMTTCVLHTSRVILWFVVLYLNHVVCVFYFFMAAAWVREMSHLVGQ